MVALQNRIRFMALVAINETSKQVYIQLHTVKLTNYRGYKGCAKCRSYGLQTQVYTKAQTNDLCQTTRASRTPEDTTPVLAAYAPKTVVLAPNGVEAAHWPRLQPQPNPSVAIRSIKLIVTSTPASKSYYCRSASLLMPKHASFFRKLLRRRAVTDQVCDKVAGRTPMTLHDNFNIERFLGWMNESPCYNLDDQNPSDWTPFQGCAYCNGLCSVLESADSVRQLLDGQRVPLFQGRYEELKSLSIRGCKFAECLIGYVDDDSETDHGLERPIALALRRVDKTGPSSVRLISLVGENDHISVNPFYLAVGTAANDPAHTITLGLPDADPTSPQNLMLLKHWLRCCASRQPGHEACPDVMPIRTELPTRVVYVGTDKEHDPPGLHLGNREKAAYVALSYCWGGPQRHQTERNRIERYMHTLPVEELPKSLQDAILLTRALGFQYIWIDSLCIIQDCDEDKDREITKMANIYKNAVLTISAATAESCDDGFLGVQEKRVQLLQQNAIKLPINCLNGAIGSVLLYPSRSLFRNTDGLVAIEKRAWTYQEQLLSRRVVSFFEDAMEWSCYSCHLSDDRLGNDELGATDPAYLELTKPSYERSYGMGQLLRVLPRHERKSPKELETLSLFWQRAVFEYTLGSLSNLDDRLPAIAGIASEFYKMTGDVYIAGLWKSCLIRDLQWRTRRQLYESSNNTGRNDFKYDAPTWTWASVHDCVIIFSSAQHDIDSGRVVIIDCKVNRVSASAPFGSVNGGELKIRAPIKFLSDREVEEVLNPTHLDDEKLDELLRLKQSSAMFIGGIFYDMRSRRHGDEPTTLRGGAALPIKLTGIWCLGLSRHADLNYESSGLALAKRADDLFERIGLFQIYVGDNWHDYGAVEQHELRTSWGDDYVVTTVTIV